MRELFESFRYLLSLARATALRLGKNVTHWDEVRADTEAIARMQGSVLSPGRLDSLTLDLLKKNGAQAYRIVRELREEIESHEPAIQQIIRAATGAEEDPRAYESLAVRQYIWHPARDPQTTTEILLGYARMTEQVVERIHDMKSNRDRRRVVSRIGKGKDLREIEEDLYLNIRNYIWSSGPEYMEERLRDTLRSGFRDGSPEDKAHYSRYVRHIFGDNARTKRETARQPAEFQKQKTQAQRVRAPARPEDIRHALRDLETLLKNEQAARDDIAAERAALEARLPVLKQELDAKGEDRALAGQIYEEQRRKTRALFNEKEEILAEIRKRGGNADGYETPDEIATLTGGTRAATAAGSLWGTAAKAEAVISQNPAPHRVQVADIEAIVKDGDTPEIGRLREAIVALRMENVTQSAGNKRREFENLQTAKMAKAAEREAEKFASRTIALEAAAATLSHDIEDLKIELKGNGSGHDARTYPPLAGLEDWARENLKDRVRIHRDAFNEAARLSDTHKHPERVYQALELLANEYWEQATSGDHDIQRAKTLRAAFMSRMEGLRIHIGSSISERKMSARLRDQYQATFDGEHVFMDQHLRRGVSRDANNILCVYFAWKPETRQVLVGHLPSHLDILRN